MLSMNTVSEGATCEEIEKIVIDDDLEKFFHVRALLLPQEKEKLIVFFKRNIDVFAWNSYKVPGVDPNFICHHLNVSPSTAPKKQPPRHSSKDHADAVKDDVTKFKQAGAIKEVSYPEWLANTVMVKKKNGRW